MKKRNSHVSFQFLRNCNSKRELLQSQTGKHSWKAYRVWWECELVQLHINFHIIWTLSIKNVVSFLCLRIFVKHWKHQGTQYINYRNLYESSVSTFTTEICGVFIISKHWYIFSETVSHYVAQVGRETVLHLGIQMSWPPHPTELWFLNTYLLLRKEKKIVPISELRLVYIKHSVCVLAWLLGYSRLRLLGSFSFSGK